MKKIITALLMLVFAAHVDVATSANKKVNVIHPLVIKPHKPVKPRHQVKHVHHIKIKKQVNYDVTFKRVSSRYLNWANPQLLKSVCGVESTMNPNAISNKGAVGLCQFMPKTWIHIAKNVDEVTPNGKKNPQQSIHAAGYYINEISQSWLTSSNSDRVKLTLASYNAGVSDLMKAQKRCGMSTSYNKIMTCLPKVNGSHKRVTTTKNYVDKILTLAKN